MHKMAWQAEAEDQIRAEYGDDARADLWVRDGWNPGQRYSRYKTSVVRPVEQGSLIVGEEFADVSWTDLPSMYRPDVAAPDDRRGHVVGGSSIETGWLHNTRLDQFRALLAPEEAAALPLDDFAYIARLWNRQVEMLQTFGRVSPETERRYARDLCEWALASEA